MSLFLLFVATLITGIILFAKYFKTKNFGITLLLVVPLFALFVCVIFMLISSWLDPQSCSSYGPSPSGSSMCFGLMVLSGILGFIALVTTPLAVVLLLIKRFLNRS